METYLRIRNWLAGEDGQGLIEYGLIVALVAIVVILLLTQVGTGLQSQFSTISSSVGGGS